MELQLQKSFLRPWQTGDEPALVKHADNISIWMNVRDHFPHPYTMSDAERWVHHASTTLQGTVFAIVVNNEAVGGIGLVRKEDVYRKSMELGYWLSQQFWGQGIMTEAIGAVTDYGFATFDIVRIYADVFEWNGASAHILEKNGFVFEARLKKAVYKNGKIGDVLMYAKIK